jgi:hypothetical protein
VNQFLQKQKHFAQRGREHKETKAVIYFESLRLRASSIIFSQLRSLSGQQAAKPQAIGWSPVHNEDPRFFLTPYAGKHGWVTLRVHAAPLNWEEIRGLVEGSSHLVSTKKASQRCKRV